MGMDLVPRKSDAETPHYNWSGWRFLSEFLDTHGVLVSLVGQNDGEWLSAAECREIAKAIEEHAAEYNEAYGGDFHGPNPAGPHAKAWRESRGMRQL